MYILDKDTLSITLMIMALISVVLIPSSLYYFSYYKPKSLSNIKYPGEILAALVILLFAGTSFSLCATLNQNLIDTFENNEELVCSKNELVSKKRGFILKGKYLVKEDKALFIDRCSILK